MSYFLRVGPGPATETGDKNYLEITPIGGKSVDITTLPSDTNLFRYYFRRVVNSANPANRESNVYAITVPVSGTGERYLVHNLATPEVNDNFRSNSTHTEEFTTASSHLWYVEPVANGSTNTPTFTGLGETAFRIQPYALHLDTTNTAFVCRGATRLDVLPPLAPPSYPDNYLFFASCSILKGPIMSSDQNTSSTTGNFYNIRTVAKMNSAFQFLSLYNDEGPTGPITNFEFEKSTDDTALFRFVAIKTKAANGVNTYAVQNKETGLFLEMYRSTARDASGNLIENFGISKTTSLNSETELEVVQADDNVFGAFKIRSYAHTNANRQVFLRFDPSDPWTIHATTEAYNESTDGFEIYFRETQ